MALTSWMLLLQFQSTPPVWAETHPNRPGITSRDHFNPLRPCGRRRNIKSRKMKGDQISIHSARVGGDYRALQGGGCITYFNPLRPCGRRHYGDCRQGCVPGNFNPLRPCGRRLDGYIFRREKSTFQSTPPVWAETPTGGDPGRVIKFQSTPPVWAETQFNLMNAARPIISIHSARVGGDP